MKGRASQPRSDNAISNGCGIPDVTVKRLGIVSRNYDTVFPNGYRDFSGPLPEILRFLDERRCDTVLFSLFSIVPRESFSVLRAIQHRETLRALLYEEFTDVPQRDYTRYVVQGWRKGGWTEHSFVQVFGSLSEKNLDMGNFVRTHLPKRVLGHTCILLCGESNGVRYSRSAGGVVDAYGMRAAIPEQVRVILNPIHDRMTRFEMALKRKFLSENGRWVVSVWNKGKQDRNGKVKDGTRPPWQVFHDGKEVLVPAIPNDLGVEMGVLSVE